MKHALIYNCKVLILTNTFWGLVNANIFIKYNICNIKRCQRYNIKCWIYFRKHPTQDDDRFSMFDFNQLKEIRGPNCNLLIHKKSMDFRASEELSYKLTT